MKLFKRMLLMGVVLAMVFGIGLMSASAASKAVVAFDGNPVTISSAYGTPFIDSANRMQVPIRVIAERLGAKLAGMGAAIRQPLTERFISKWVQMK
jgi:hypothetical protein